MNDRPRLMKSCLEKGLIRNELNEIDISNMMNTTNNLFSSTKSNLTNKSLNPSYSNGILEQKSQRNISIFMETISDDFLKLKDKLQTEKKELS